jgi:hypothetical protein
MPFLATSVAIRAAYYNNPLERAQQRAEILLRKGKRDAFFLTASGRRTKKKNSQAPIV